MDNDPKVVIVGGGLAGALLATYLGRQDFDVEVYELRDDLRRAGAQGGRSINLALSHRGIEALRGVGLADEILRMAVPMRGRMIHAPSGDLSFQPYGKDAHHANHSLSRNGLNAALLEAASRSPRVKLYFRRKCIDADLHAPTATFLDLDTNGRSVIAADMILSADGAFSAVRAPMLKHPRFDFSQSYLEYGYKELTMPADDRGGWRLERNALHIWPRRSYMMIALPNLDGSFTCTLFWPYEGPVSFASVQSGSDISAVFQEHFADALPLMPTLMEDYARNPVGSLVTIRCAPWYVDDKVLLLGDAAHAIVPFYGQGMNAAFEDVLVLSESLARHRPHWETAFREVFESRKEHTDTLADLAIGNFVEMRDRTGSRWFRWKKKSEAFLARAAPWWYIPLYTMVSFSRTPYADAVRRARRQNFVAAGGVIVLLALILVVLCLCLRSTSPSFLIALSGG